MSDQLPEPVRRVGVLPTQDDYAAALGAAPAPPNIRELLDGLRKHLWIILVLAVLGGGAAAYRVWSAPPLYEAKASIRLKDVRRSIAGGLADGPSERLTGGVIDPVLSQIEALTSRTVAKMAIDTFPQLRLSAQGFDVSRLSQVSIENGDQPDSLRLTFLTHGVKVHHSDQTLTALYGRPISVGGLRFAVAESEPGEGTLYLVTVDKAVRRLLGGLTVIPRATTDVVDVTYRAGDRAVAREVVNRLVTAFQLASATGAQQESFRRRQFLERQLQHHDSVLAQARLALAGFRGRQRAYSAEARMSAEQAELSGVQVRRKELEADRRIYLGLLAELERSGTDADGQRLGAVLSAPGIATNPVVTDLYTQLIRYQVSRDSMAAGPWGHAPTHPDVQRLDRLIVSTRQRLVDAVRSVVKSVEARIASLDELRAERATSFPQLSASEEEEARLEEELESARTLVTQLRGEYEKARLAEAVEVGQVEIMDLADDARVVVGRGRLLIVFGAMAGLLLGSGFAFLRERANTSIRRPGQLETGLQIAELGIIPPNRGRLRRTRRERYIRSRPVSGNHHGGPGSIAVDAALVAAADLHSVGAEAYRVLRTNLLFSQTSQIPRTIMITSPAPGDGKTTVAANLAVTFAQQGVRVLLVDADLRRGCVHRLFRIPREPGFSQLMEGSVGEAEAIRGTGVPGLFVLPTGRIPPMPAELLGSDSTRAYVRRLSLDYQVVIIDTPPVLAAADATIMAPVADAVLMVVRAGETEEQEARAALQRLMAVGAKVLGAVLNDRDAELDRAGPYYYSGYYGPVAES